MNNIDNAKFGIYGASDLVYSDEHGGAVFNKDDELWYPFSFFDNGDLDVNDYYGGFIKPSSAYKMYKKIFT
jgi:hypothetical protein